MVIAVPVGLFIGRNLHDSPTILILLIGYAAACLVLLSSAVKSAIRRRTGAAVLDGFLGFSVLVFAL